MVKQPTTYTWQIAKLQERGCKVSDEDFCKDVLARVNYYRLSAYFLPFRKGDGTYKENTDFNRVYQIYEFDRKFRNILFLASEEVEVFL